MRASILVKEGKPGSLPIFPTIQRIAEQISSVSVTKGYTSPTTPPNIIYGV